MPDEISKLLTESSLRRLSHMAGSGPLSSTLVDDLREHAQIFVRNLSNKLHILLQGAQKKTVSVDMVVYAAKLLHQPTLGLLHPPDTKCKTKVFKGRNVRVKNIRHMQKQSDCLLLSKATFARILKSTMRGAHGGQFPNSMKVTGDAVRACQVLLEDYLVNFIHDAGIVAIHAGRNKVKREDITVIKYLRARHHS